MCDHTVNIFGRDYSIKLEASDTEEVKRLSGQLDRMISQEAVINRNVNPASLGMLAAMRLLEENLQLRRQLLSNSVI